MNTVAAGFASSARLSSRNHNNIVLSDPDLHSVNQIPKPCGKQTVPLIKRKRKSRGAQCEEREEGNDSAGMLSPYF